MMFLLDFPSIVKKYSKYFESCFSEEGYAHFNKAISGFLVGENKTLTGINKLFVNDSVNQSSFNRFFNRRGYDLDDVNKKRLSMLHDQDKLCFKEGPGGGVLSIDNSLLKHYGKHFDNIYYIFDYVYKNYRWCHDLVTLHYSDDETDYPVHYKLWEPPDWEAVANYFMEVGYHINEEKWENRKKEPQKWRNYIRSRYKTGRKKHPEVIDLYKTKLHIGEELLRKFLADYPDMKLPVALDSGFTSSEFCEIISGKLGLDYVGCLQGRQSLILKGSREVSAGEFAEELKAQHHSGKSVFRKLSFKYKGEVKTCYAYVSNHRVKGYKKKQRLVISFLKEDLTDNPSFTISNKLDWYPGGILRIRRHRWPVETYHQEGKSEGLEKYQVRNLAAIQTYIAFVVVAYSMLKCSVHDKPLLDSIQQRLQTETDGTLPFLRRLMKLEGLALFIEYILAQSQAGSSFEQILDPLIRHVV